MSALFLALALLATDPEPAVAVTPAAAAAPVEDAIDMTYPAGAPHDDYGLVAWCYGALSGYLELHDQMIPEVSRIEAAFQRPGATLAGDMAVYDDMQKASLGNIKLFAKAMEAAERASLRPINARGAAAVRSGRATWAGADTLPTRQVAQEWMGWALPNRCTVTAQALEARARLMGTAFKVNDDPPPATDAVAPIDPTPVVAPSDQTSPASPPT